MSVARLNAAKNRVDASKEMVETSEAEYKVIYEQVKQETRQGLMALNNYDMMQIIEAALKAEIQKPENQLRLLKQNVTPNLDEVIMFYSLLNDCNDSFPSAILAHIPIYEKFGYPTTHPKYEARQNDQEYTLAYNVGINGTEFINNGIPSVKILSKLRTDLEQPLTPLYHPLFLYNTQTAFTLETTSKVMGCFEHEHEVFVVTEDMVYCLHRM